MHAAVNKGTSERMRAMVFFSLFLTHTGYLCIFVLNGGTKYLTKSTKLVIPRKDPTRVALK